MIWAAAILVLIPAAWWGRFWLALGLAHALRRLARGRQALGLRRAARRLTRYSAR